MSVVALVIAPSIALSLDDVSAYVNGKQTVETTIKMNVESNDFAEATIVYTTTVNGVSTTEEKIIKGTQAEVKAQLEAFENTTVKSNDDNIEVKIEKVDIRK